MSTSPQVRRTDKLMSDEETLSLLAESFAGRLGTVGPDGWPYVVPLLYVWMDGIIYVHNTRAVGHLRTNIDHDPRVCFEVDEPGEIFAYGRFDCDTSVSYRSAIVYGTVRVAEDVEEKARFCTELMRKYAGAKWERPKDFFPRLDQITVYAITPERITGKKTPLPASAEQWPELDRTKSPQAVAP